ncbi:MAG: hypothetical protein K2H18_06920, partial [Muribaculaceae bacterium]|nr:hypothetical protein [Muribaculaceae bacterium]
MDTTERHVRENNEHKQERINLEEAERMAKAQKKMRENESKRRSNKVWMWLGVVILIFILLFWIFDIGTWEDLMG